MSHKINISLTNELKHYVDKRTGDQDFYSTTNEYICDLIRHDMEDYGIALKIMDGLDDIKNNRFSKKSILDIKNES